MPEETSYLLTRMQKPWVYLVIASPFFNFLIPLFALIPRASKWNPWVFLPLSVMILLSQWMNYLLVVIPEVASPSNWSLPWLEIGILLGFLGLFLISFFRFAGSVPMINIADPLFQNSMTVRETSLGSLRNLYQPSGLLGSLFQSSHQR